VFYADDLAIIATNNVTMNMALEELRNYCNENDIRVNIGKTKCLRFTRGGRVRQEETVKYGDAVPEMVRNLIFRSGVMRVPGQTQGIILRWVKEG